MVENSITLKDVRDCRAQAFASSTFKKLIVRRDQVAKRERIVPQGVKFTSNMMDKWQENQELWERFNPT